MKRYFILTADSLESLEQAVHSDLDADQRREPVGSPFLVRLDLHGPLWGQAIFLREAER
jgi:hypothetical protein